MYVFQIGHSGKPSFIITTHACWTYQHLGSQAVLINHIVLLILYIYCDCNLCVSLYLFPCLTLFFVMRKIYIFFSSVILTLIKIVLLQSELLVYGPLGQRWCSEKYDPNFSGVPIIWILCFLSSTHRENHTAQILWPKQCQKRHL